MKKFGTFSGVFVPSYEAMLGAVVFLILPGLVGGLGLAKMLVIIVVAHSLTAATAFSIADCTSNLEKIGAGGMYVLASRSLGKAFGGSIGIQLFLAQAVSIGFYSIGFADPMQKIVASVPAVQGIISAYGLSPLVQKQIIATLVAAVAFVFGIFGKDIVVKTQKVIFAVLSVSIAAMLV
ncbi:MAG: amino acid permease, partial [Spirochaetales bacterium]|nr:amino acid permease [Spirochaetales bacterium]